MIKQMVFEPTIPTNDKVTPKLFTVTAIAAVTTRTKLVRETLSQNSALGLTDFARVNKTERDLLAIAYVVVLAIALANLDSGAVTRVGLPPTATFSSVFSVIPTFIFAFTCHQNILLCAEDLRARTHTNGV
mmetsp:Transcript_10388/g.10300  ORF Transcript_10388/g.10300 Transcript_10388/m.10300 type:complete len:131 (+) Transcript_10388:141-533(+)